MSIQPGILVGGVKMMRYKRCILLAVLGLAAATLACVLWGNRISDKQRTQTLDDLAAFHDSLPGLDEDADRQALVDYMLSRPEFKSAEVSEDGSVWGEFTDSRLVVFVVPMGAFGESQDGGDSLGGASVSARLPFSPVVEKGAATHRELINLKPVSSRSGLIDSVVTHTKAGELPAGKRGVIISAVDTTVYGSQEYTIRDLLEKKNYSVSEVDASIDSLKTINDVDVFYFKTHGSCWDRILVADEHKAKISCALMTSTPYSRKNDEMYANDLNNVRLAYMRLEEQWYYAITDYFVSEYMHFGKNSFVYITACHSHNTAMHLGFQYAGASVYAGWTNSVRSSIDAKASTALFDLLLGTNHVVKSEPPHRPFDYASIAVYLADKGYDTSVDKEGNISKLKITPLSGDFAILAPSIRNMEVDEQEETLTLHGIFGTNLDQVTINSISIAVEEWTAEKIVVNLPGAMDTAGVGDVIVTVRDHESNAVPLTRWHGELRYFQQPIENWDIKQSADFDVYFRADVHPYREEPGGELIYPHDVHFEISNDSSATFTCSGSKVIDLSAFDAGIVTTLASGMGEMQVDHTFEGGCFTDSSFDFRGTIDTALLTFKPTLLGCSGWGSGCTLTTEGETEPWAMFIFECVTKGVVLPMDDFEIYGDRVECDEGENILYKIVLEPYEFKVDSPPID